MAAKYSPPFLVTWHLLSFYPPDLHPKTIACATQKDMAFKGFKYHTFTVNIFGMLQTWIRE